MIETALAPYKVGINGITMPILIPLLRCFFVARCALYDEKKSFPGFLRGKDFLCFYPNGRRALAGILDLRNFDQSETQNSKEIIMKFNYGLERKRFEREWNKLRQQYLKAGMDEYAVEEMYAFDLAVFNDTRVIAKWEQPFIGDTDTGDEDESPLLLKFSEQLSKNDDYFSEASRFSWMEQISDEALYVKLRQLPGRDKELLTLLAFEEYTKTEIARILGKAPSTITRNVTKLGKYLFSA